MGSMKDLLGDTPYPEQQRAYARSTDLQTSHDAARRVEVVLTKLQKAVFDCIKARGATGATWNEISAITGIDKGSVSPRLKPLREKGLIQAKRNFDGHVERREHQIVWVWITQADSATI